MFFVSFVFPSPPFAIPGQFRNGQKQSVLLTVLVAVSFGGHQDLLRCLQCCVEWQLHGGTLVKILKQMHLAVVGAHMHS